MSSSSSFNFFILDEQTQTKIPLTNFCSSIGIYDVKQEYLRVMKTSNETDNTNPEPTVSVHGVILTNDKGEELLTRDTVGDYSIQPNETLFARCSMKLQELRQDGKLVDALTAEQLKEF